MGTMTLPEVAHLRLFKLRTEQRNSYSSEIIKLSANYRKSKANDRLTRDVKDQGWNRNRSDIDILGKSAPSEFRFIK